MAGEVMLINPRRRGRHKRRRRSTRSHARPHRRKRRRVAAYANPRRKRRVGRRHRRIGARRRHHRNPRILGGSFMGVNVGQALTGGLGFVGANLAAAHLMKFLPPQWTADPNTGNLVRIGSKAAVTIGGAMLLKRTPLKGFATAWAVGGGIATVVDALQTYLLPAIGMSDYQQGMLEDYQQGVLQGYSDPSAAEGLYGSDAYGNSAYS
jgi:hypothetical protein